MYVIIKSSLGRLTQIEHAAAAAKLLQSCLTLCDPIDGSPPGTQQFQRDHLYRDFQEYGMRS